MFFFTLFNNGRTKPKMSETGSYNCRTCFSWGGLFDCRFEEDLYCCSYNVEFGQLNSYMYDICEDISPNEMTVIRQKDKYHSSCFTTTRVVVVQMM